MRSTIILLAGALLGIVSCDDPLKMFPDHQIGEPRLLALKVSEPELPPEARPTMRLLIGGEGFEQESDLPILWLVPNNKETLTQIPPEILSLLWAPYSSDFSLPEGMTIGSLLAFSPNLQAAYEKNGFVDLPIFASVVIADKPLSLMKKVRITKKPRHKNPEITAIKAVWKGADGELSTRMLGRDDTLELSQKDLSDYLGLAPETRAPAELGNDLLVFRWQFNEDPLYATELRFCDADCPSDEYLGVSRTTPVTREIMIDFEKTKRRIAHAPPDGDLTIMFYLVVRDRATEAVSNADDRYGLDFTTLRLLLKKP